MLFEETTNKLERQRSALEMELGNKQMDNVKLQEALGHAEAQARKSSDELEQMRRLWQNELASKASLVNNCESLKENSQKEVAAATQSKQRAIKAL